MTEWRSIEELGLAVVYPNGEVSRSLYKMSERDEAESWAKHMKGKVVTAVTAPPEAGK